MYAVIRAGGKQFKVSEGDVIEVERVRARDAIRFEPILVVDDDGTPRAGRSELAGAAVQAEVLGEVKGPKVEVVKYRAKTGYRRHTGHRQRYARLRISSIDAGRPKRSKSRREASDGS